MWLSAFVSQSHGRTCQATIKAYFFFRQLGHLQLRYQPDLSHIRCGSVVLWGCCRLIHSDRKAELSPAAQGAPRSWAVSYPILMLMASLRLLLPLFSADLRGPPPRPFSWSHHLRASRGGKLNEPAGNLNGGRRGGLCLFMSRDRRGWHQSCDTEDISF